MSVSSNAWTPTAGRRARPARATRPQQQLKDAGAQLSRIEEILAGTGPDACTCRQVAAVLDSSTGTGGRPTKTGQGFSAGAMGSLTPAETHDQKSSSKLTEPVTPIW
ncbi:hypothetical protein Acsp02_82320 [Actinoplanes sp. NBRC 103695]|nr:hypothetical protein Acsp02_82320 [Actinoplanes sp. NBRC 103695]